MRASVLICSGLALAAAAAWPAGAADPAAPATADAAPGADLLAAARLADELYQLHLRSLYRQLADPRIEARIDALRTLRRLDDPLATDEVLPFLAGATRSVDELVAGCLTAAELGSPRAVAPLRLLLNHRDDRVRVAAGNALDRLAKTTVPEVLARTGDGNATLRLTGAAGIGQRQIAEAGDRLERILAGDAAILNRRTAAIALGRLGDRARAPALRNALADPDPGVRRYAAEALALLDDKPAIPFLLMALEANIAGGYIHAAIRRLTDGQDFGFNERGTLADRQGAVDRGFAWWAAYAKSQPAN